MTQPRISIAARTRCGIDASAGRSPAAGPCWYQPNQTSRHVPAMADLPTRCRLPNYRRPAAQTAAGRQQWRHAPGGCRRQQANKPACQHAAVEADRSSRSMQQAAAQRAALQAVPASAMDEAVQSSKATASIWRRSRSHSTEPEPEPERAGVSGAGAAAGARAREGGG